MGPTKVWFLYALSAVGIAAEAPSSIANLVYYESNTTTARTRYWRGFLMEPNGVARGLFLISTQPGWKNPVRTSEQPSGTWTYTKGADGTAELQIKTVESRDDNGRRTLTFTSPETGTMRFEEAFAIFGSTFYLVPAASRAPLVNCSNRSFIPSGRSALTGFVVAGNRPRAALIRAIGPGLRAFGVTDASPDPRLSVRQDAQILAENDDWEVWGRASVVATSAFVGAFPLSAGSKDAAVIAMLDPGAYVAEVSAGSPSDSGETLVEVYLLP